ncbi:MAG: hypothetical protein HYX59_13285 [Elusimicrobia bacterium]|nr:hypothetical protein [Elusimicrobiota bacterium]
MTGNEMGVWELVKSDLNRYVQHSCSYEGRKSPSFRKYADCILFKAGFHASLIYRISHWFYQHGLIFCARILMRLNITLNGSDIGFTAKIGPGLVLGHPVGIVIAQNTEIGANAFILQGVTFGVKNWEPGSVNHLPKVGDNCIFCNNSTILGGVKIGNDCVVSSYTLLTKDMEEGSYALGIPAKIEPNRGRESIASWVV